MKPKKLFFDESAGEWMADDFGRKRQATPEEIDQCQTEIDKQCKSSGFANMGATTTTASQPTESTNYSNTLAP